MQTLTFYSYKGGVGRSLALANNAYYLSKFGFKVCIIDFDLEAPGLSYKFKVKDGKVKLGIVDYIYEYWEKTEIPASLEPYTIKLKTKENEGELYLIPAGDVQNNDYWHNLSSINWHELLFQKNRQGILFFLELKERIKKEINPDFLLIDSRTGVTEIGGICTTILPDSVILLLTNNEENIDGVGRIMKGIQNAPRLNERVINTHFVLTRLPLNEDNKGKSLEENITSNIRKELNAKMDAKIRDLYVIHSNRQIELKESLVLNYAKDSNNKDYNILLDDYIRLFSNILDKNIIEPRLDQFIDNILSGLLSDPDDTQNKLEELADAFPHHKTYERLLSFYNLRNEKDKYIQLFNKYYAINRNSLDPILLEKYANLFVSTSIYYWPNSKFRLYIIEHYFNNSLNQSISLGIKLAEGYAQSNVDKAISIYKSLLNFSPDNVQLNKILESLLDLYYEKNSLSEGMSVIRDYFNFISNNDNLKISYIKYLLKMSDIEELNLLIKDIKFNNDNMAFQDPLVMYEVYDKLGLKESFTNKINNILDIAIENEDFKKVVDIGHIYGRIGWKNTYEKVLKNSKIPNRTIESILRDVNIPF